MHENLKSKHLKDKKHLNEKGVKLFAQSLKRAYFNKPTRTLNFPQNQQYRTQYTQSIFYQPNPYNHYPILNNRQQKHIPQRQTTANTTPLPPLMAFNPYDPYHLSMPYHQHSNISSQPKMNERMSKQDNPKISSELIDLIKHLNMYVI